MKDRVDAVEHIWCKSDDRWIYVEYNEQRKIIGLNFMQSDEYESFKDNWCHADPGLTEYYEAMIYTFPIEKSSVDTLVFINKCMWAYHTAVSNYQEHTDGVPNEVHRNNFKHNIDKFV